MGKDYNEYAASEILEWARATTPVVRVHTARDATPGGLSLAMAPAVVNWKDSSIGFGPDDFYLVHNVNIASNPVGGNTLLATVRVPAGGIETVEFVMVISKVAGRETSGGHGMIRFIFKDDNLPVILDSGGDPLANDAKIKDLVLSWEAWRPPAASFNPVAGLDPESYALTMRCFSGSVRCLTDAFLDRPWICYPLQMPDVEHAAGELLYVSLLLGDVVARHTIMGLMDKQISQAENLPGDYKAAEGSEWEEIKGTLEREKMPDDPIHEILDGNIRYHLLLRSCITMALTSIDWANIRMHRRAGRPDPARVRIAPSSLPGLLDDLVLGKRRSALARLPGALHWLIGNQSVIPGKAHQLLDEPGLLQRENGQLVRTHYDNRRESPYGVVSDNVIF